MNAKRRQSLDKHRVPRESKQVPMEASEAGEASEPNQASEEPRPEAPPPTTGHSENPADNGAPNGTSTQPGPSLAEERDRLREQLLRTAADFDNFRKRARRDMDEAVRRSREDTLRELLPVFDNLERALTAARTAQDMQAIVQGVDMVLRMFEDVGGRLGLEKVSAQGQPFDPALHEALQQLETSEHPAGTVVNELVPGYRFAGRLLRPAMVVVARAPSNQPQASAEEKSNVEVMTQRVDKQSGVEGTEEQPDDESESQTRTDSES